MNLQNYLVVIRGGGDLATGVAHRLVQSGFRVAILEIEKPTVIRRTVAFASALFSRTAEVEGIKAVRAGSLEEARACIDSGKVPVLVDPDAESILYLKPYILVDAILAKRNMGTHINMAPIVIGLGPGFTAGEDVHAVIETNRGHNLGRVILKGGAEPNTGIPGTIGGYDYQRVLRAPSRGIVRNTKEICTEVKSGEIVAYVEDVPVTAALDGVLRGMIMDGLTVERGLKIGDVDPRCKPEYCHTISDKARAIGGGVLEAILHLQRKESEM